MNDQKHYKFSTVTLAIPLYFVLFLWVVFWFELKYGFNFNKYGIYPRSLKGLRGIIFSPFIHGDIKHLYHNTIPLFLLLFSLLYFYREIASKVFVYGAIFTGILTWIIARRSYHIGASGLIYFLFSFLFFSGIIRKNIRLIAVALVVIFLYGSMIWYVLPVKEGVSWEGHLSGFLIGLVFAFIYRKKGLQKFKYEWEKEDYQPTDFDEMFDENGMLKSEEEDESQQSEK